MTTNQRQIKNPNGGGIVSPGLQEIQDASTDKPSYLYNGNPTLVSCGDSDQFTFGNGVSDSPFTLLCTCRNNANGGDLISKWAGVQDEYQFIYGSDSLLYFYLSHLNFSSYIQVTAPNPIDTKVHTFVSTYDGRGGVSAGSGVNLYIDSIKLATTITSSGTYVAMNNGTSAMVIGNQAGATLGFHGNIYRSMVFNYVLSAEKISRYSSGAKLDWEDIGGSMIDYVSGRTWANVTAGTFTFSGNDITSCIAASLQYARLSLAVLPIVAGKVYRLYFSALTITSGIPQLVLTNAGDSAYISPFVTLVAGTSYVDFYPTVSSATAYLRVDAFNGAFNLATLTITNMVQLGAIADLEPEGITSTKWIDQSGNSLDGTVTNAIPVNEMAGLMKGITNGMAVPAGYVGDCLKATWADPIDVTLTTSFATIYSITIVTPGIYTLSYNVSVAAVTAATATAITKTLLRVVKSGTLIGNSLRALYSHAHTNDANIEITSLSYTETLYLAAGQYDLQGIKLDPVGPVGAGHVYNDSSNYQSTFQALRMV
jgi:hypothetical protein